MARAKKNGCDPAADHCPALGSLIKSARDIMRKDKGLSTATSTGCRCSPG